MESKFKIAILTPSINSIRRGNKPMTPDVITTLNALREQVEVLREYEDTGNSKVRDSAGRIFYCNSNDLSYNLPVSAAPN